MGVGSTVALPREERDASVGATGYLLLGSAAVGLAGNALVGTPCALRLATGHHCALCGGTRAMAALLHGDFLHALNLNAVVSLALLLVVAAAAVALTVPATRVALDRAVAMILDLRASRLALAILVWTIVRNLPGLEMLRPSG